MCGPWHVISKWFHSPDGLATFFDGAHQVVDRAEGVHVGAPFLDLHLEARW